MYNNKDNNNQQNNTSSNKKIILNDSAAPSPNFKIPTPPPTTSQSKPVESQKNE